MSDYHRKRQRSRSRSFSRSSKNKQTREDDSHQQHHHHHLVQSNRPYNSHHLLDLNISINEVINSPGEYPPIIQLLVSELLNEQKKRVLIEKRLDIYQHDYTVLNNKYEQAITDLTLINHDFDKCRNDLQNTLSELNRLHHLNGQLKLDVDHLLNNERQRMHPDDPMLYLKRQPRY